MVKRTNHYDVAFEEYLRGTCTPYVAVDEQRGAASPTPRSSRWISSSRRQRSRIYWSTSKAEIPVGRRGRGVRPKWENWATEDDITACSLATSLRQRFSLDAAFAYEIVDPRCVGEWAGPFVHQGRAVFVLWRVGRPISPLHAAAFGELGDGLAPSRNYRESANPHCGAIGMLTSASRRPPRG